MKKSVLMIFLAMFFLTSCSTNVAEPLAANGKPATTPKIEIVFDGDVAPVLAAEDDYIKAFSAFDYAAKLKSETPLDYKQRLQIYSSAIEPYTEKEKEKITRAFDAVLPRLAGIQAKLPNRIIVFSDGQTESGEAYTRQNTMCLTKKMMRFMSEKRLTELVAHEMFHIISRNNKDDREKWYRILGYQKVNDIVWPDELKQLTLANPDAPQSNYVLHCEYNGKQYDFMHVLYADAPYDIGSNKSFFKYLKDEMMAVEVVDNNPKPIYVDGKLLIVEKSKLVGFTEQVGENTKYTIHPEETTADHFAMLIMDKYKDAPSPDMIEALHKLMYRPE